MRRLLLSMVGIMLLTACAPTLKMEQYKTGQEMVKVEELPHNVAILPFSNGTSEPNLDQLVRRNFANHFTSKSYRDIKLPVVDEKLVVLAKSTGKPALETSPKELAAALGCDGLVYGRVSDYKRIYAGVYSQFGIEAEIWMVNATTGKELFRLKEAVRYHEGGIPTSPLSLVVTAVSTAMNLREIQQVRLVNELCYKFMEKIPAPASLAAENRPAIKEVLSNVTEGPFGRKKTLRVGLEGEAGLVATFAIGNFKQGLPMREVKPGIYMGEYAVLPGDNVADMPLVVTLTRPGGYESQWTDPSGYVTIDTVAPPKPVLLKAKGYPDRVELAWDGAKGHADLKGYRVMRSEQPLSGYSELTVTETPAWQDRSAAAGKTYFYKIAAFDIAGNEGESTDPQKGALVALEPISLAGELKGDTELDGAYLVKETVIVPRGMTLTIIPESRLMFAQGSGLTVNGRLVLKGKDCTAEFVPAGSEQWLGLTLDGAKVEMTGFRVRGALTGITLKNAEGKLEDGVITESGRGLVIAGIAPLQVVNCTISGNKTGIELVKSNSKITGCTISQNEDGVVVDSFSGEIRDNNIMDNKRNLLSSATLSVGANFFGSTNFESLRISGATVEKIYDARLPGGKVVAPIINPYAGLTPDERKLKATEMVIEAGTYFRQSNYGKAAATFKSALQANPSADIYYYLGVCHLQMRENDQAEFYLKEGVEKFPQDAVLWKSLGMYYYEKGAEPEARKSLQEALRLSPEDRQAKFLLERMTGK